jgi:ribonucleoside-diphosphate reductase alpha chain
LKVLCEKFAHTRFEPSGWTGNEQIGYAKSLMDYMFRWLSLRFLSGEQLALFAGLAPKQQQLPEPRTMLGESDADEDAPAAPQQSIARLAEEVAKRLNQMATSGQMATSASNPATSGGPASGGGIAPEMQPRQASAAAVRPPAMQDRGLYHASDAMRGMYDMGDAPSCNVCGAIMVRNGSCYRCMSCGSTSGCS